ncbi:MAG TPA: hypothetical protein DIT65_07110 [Cryomorphaceae bacterium]|nr:hypothetical protein [Cryomorphaceae bacterium]|tara:strand:+ start:1357 stop:1830 length:474 start_codon:yes stop_codon:yes gene_type:complete
MGMQTMNPESSIWFYGLKKPMNTVQAHELKVIMEEFVGGWEAHGAKLAAAYRIIKDQFLIIAIDETQQQATGCSIDKSVHLLQEFGAKQGLDFFNRMLVHVMENETFTSYSTLELKAAIAEGKIGPNTQVMNTTAATLKESLTGTLDLADSWAAKYI